MRAARAERVCAELVCAEAPSREGVDADAVEVATGALPIAGIGGVAIDSDDDAIWPY